MKQWLVVIAAVLGVIFVFQLETNSERMMREQSTPQRRLEICKTLFVDFAFEQAYQCVDPLVVEGSPVHAEALLLRSKAGYRWRDDSRTDEESELRAVDDVAAALQLSLATKGVNPTHSEALEWQRRMTNHMNGL